MDPRYVQTEVVEIWAIANKLALWQKTELAVIQARVLLGQVDNSIFVRISEILNANPIDIEWWKARNKEIGHDLNAFLDERLRFLPPELQPFFHQDMTFYDTEEPAFARMLKSSLALVNALLPGLTGVLTNLAKKYRYTIMMGRTHGQEAELQTFGKRCLAWLKEIGMCIRNIQQAAENLKYSKISGALGNYGSIEPVLEKEALAILGFEPFYGATQIMPRSLYASLAQALCQLVQVMDKIALDIRLGAKSGRPIYQEPFGKKQKGSSRMPHKKNTISTEQIEGMARMARGYLSMIMDNIRTWEERAIEQSCVERVAWPDLFHVVVHSLKTMTRILDGLAVYPDNMLREIIDSRGCYASGEAKDFLRTAVVSSGFTSEDAYRMVQLAAFNAFAPTDRDNALRLNPCVSFREAENWLRALEGTPPSKPKSIQHILFEGKLKFSPQLEATEEDIRKWNEVLIKIFSQPDNRAKWNEIFSPSYLLRHEKTLFKEILGV